MRVVFMENIYQIDQDCTNKLNMNGFIAELLEVIHTLLCSFKAEYFDLRFFRENIMFLSGDQICQ